MASRIARSWKQLLGNFHRNARGGIAVMFGVSAVPVAIAASVALDMANVSDVKSQLQAAADTAVLAAATRLAVNAEDSDKEALARTTFDANLSPQLLADLTSTPSVVVDFPSKTVSMAVQVTTGTMLSRLVTDDIMLHVNASATVSPGTPICMMALNPSAAKSINIQGTADLIADGCAVHVNSSHPDKALYQTGTGSGSADSFCVHGGYEGSNFTPNPRNRCMVENDPLAEQFAADWAAEQIDTRACDFSNLAQINAGAGVVTTLDPGVYCGGLTIKQGTVQLVSGGLYIFRNGPLYIQAHGTLKGTNVAILFTGDNTTRLITQAGANIITSARSDPGATFRGLAFAQDPNSIPANENIIVGGGQIEINGIMYYPEQPLKITGNGSIGTTAAQFAIMADTISIEGNGQLVIHIGQNYATTGLPDLPEAQEIVYLNE